MSLAGPEDGVVFVSCARTLPMQSPRVPPFAAPFSAMAGHGAVRVARPSPVHGNCACLCFLWFGVQTGNDVRESRDGTAGRHTAAVGCGSSG